VVSDTLKIVHTKFSPMPMTNGHQTKMKRAYGHNLYVINEEVMYGAGSGNGVDDNNGEAMGETIEESENMYEPNIMMNPDSSVLDSQNFTPGQQRELSKSVLPIKKGGMSQQQKSIVF
jgi:hypothetical protein